MEERPCPTRPLGLPTLASRPSWGNGERLPRHWRPAGSVIGTDICELLHCDSNSNTEVMHLRMDNEGVFHFY